MRDDDAPLEKVLAGLRDAEPSSSLQLRILARLDAQPVRRAGWLRPAIALACALLAAALVYHFRTVPARVKIVATRAPGLESVPPVPPMVVARPRHRQKPVLHRVAAPLALTAQEKLLLRLAHRRDDAALAILNPDARAAQSASAAAEFQHFFAIDDGEMRSQLE